MLSNPFYASYVKVENAWQEKYGEHIIMYPSNSSVCIGYSPKFQGLIKIRYVFNPPKEDWFFTSINIHKKIIEYDQTMPKILDVFNVGDVYCKVIEWIDGVDLGTLQRKLVKIPPIYYYKFGYFLYKLTTDLEFYLYDSAKGNVIYRYKYDDLMLCDFGSYSIVEKEEHRECLEFFLRWSVATGEQVKEFYCGYKGIKK